MVEALDDRDNGSGERSTNEVLEILGSERPLLERLTMLVASDVPTLRALFRRPGKKGRFGPDYLHPLSPAA